MDFIDKTTTPRIDTTERQEYNVRQGAAATDTHKSIDVIHWVKTNKFWTSVIILFIITAVMRAFGKPLEYGAFYSLFFYYTMIFGLIWSGYVGKKGMTLITWGIVSLLFSLFAWGSIVSNWEFNASGFIFAIVPTFLSVLLFYYGIKRYRHWLKNSAASSL